MSEVNGGGGAVETTTTTTTTDTNGGTPEWMGGLSEELRGDATLSRYKDLDSFARGHLETKKLASGKLALPAADAGDDVWNGVWDALGRPKEAAGYGDLGFDPLPDDADDAAKTAREAALSGYRDAFHQIGVPPRLASALARADMERIAAAEAAYYGEGEKKLGALRDEMGADYEPQLKAAKSTFLKLFGDDAAPLADELDRKVGSDVLVRGMMKLAKLTGEHGRVDGQGGDITTGGGDAQKQLDAKYADKGWREKLNNGDVAVRAEYDRLLDAAKKQAVTKRT
jgi:hypothetical protein